MLFIAVAVLAIGVWLFCLFDALTAPAEDIRLMQKALWILVLLLLPVSSVLWLMFGRPRAGVAGLEGRDRREDPWGGAFERRSRPNGRRVLAPDDAPDFLRSIGRDDDGPTPTR